MNSQWSAFMHTTFQHQASQQYAHFLPPLFKRSPPYPSSVSLSSPHSPLFHCLGKLCSVEQFVDFVAFGHLVFPYHDSLCPSDEGDYSILIFIFLVDFTSHDSLHFHPCSGKLDDCTFSESSVVFHSFFI